MTRECAVRLLGGFEVRLDSQAVWPEAWRHRRGADLVKLLALAPGHRLHREQVMAALWPELEAEAAGANLRKALHFARRALEGQESIVQDQELLQLWPEGDLTVDLELFEVASKQALTAGTGEESAAQLYTGELLPADRYAEWTEPRRENARFLCLELWRAAGRWEQVLEVDRADEEAHRALMEQHLAAGRRQAAIRQFQRLRDVLRVDLGVSPSEETVALFERALEAAGPEPPTVAERAQALLARGLLAWSRMELPEAERIAEEVRLLALGHELARELGEASALLGMVAFAQGRWIERFRTEFEQALRLAPPESAFLLAGHVCLAETTLGSADCASVAQLARELLPLARQAGSGHGEAVASLLIGETDLLAGLTDEAEPWLRSAAELFEEVGSGSGQVLARVYLAEAARRHGRRQAAVETLTAVQPLAEASDLAPHLAVRVWAGLVAGAEAGEARLEVLEQAEQELHRGQACSPCSIGLRVNGVIACAHAGEIARARRCLAEAESLAGMWPGGPWRAAVWEARGTLRLAEGDSEQAAGLYREASTLFGECGRAFDQERCAREAVEAGNAVGTAPL